MVAHTQTQTRTIVVSFRSHLLLLSYLDKLFISKVLSSSRFVETVYVNVTNHGKENEEINENIALFTQIKNAPWRKRKLQPKLSLNR